MRERIVLSAPVAVVVAGAWLLLHGDWSVANVVGGLVIGCGLVIIFPIDRGRLRHRLNPWQMLRWIVFVLYSLVLSSWEVIKVVVRPTPASLRAGVVRVRLETESELTTTLVANAVTLTPGTMTLTARTDPAELHIHVLGLSDPEAFRESVYDLERRTVAALTPIFPAEER